MYNVLLTVYSESSIKGGIKIKEKIYYSGPFSTFEDAQNYMDNEAIKKIKAFNSNHHVETESNVIHDRISVANESNFYYKCYDYRIESF
ncbi:MAG: hypothetical protein ACRCTZ_03600 [Sarcina sp.]